MARGACIAAGLLSLLPFFTCGATSTFRSQCLAFDPTSLLPNSTLRLQEHIPANTTIRLPGMDPSCSRTSELITAEACRIALTLTTSDRSSTILETFLPPAQDWSGRFLATGNGGIDGCIKYEDIAYGLQHGFATTGTNNGHNGTGGKEFFGNVEVVKDFSYRSLHTSATAGKTLIEAFYDRPANRSYYIGCSGGGRQGVQAAALYPEDFDGIVAGAPAINFNMMSSWRASFFTYTGTANVSEFIKPDVWHGIIHEEVLRQCDGLDGVKDGILEDASLCAVAFRPEALLCRNGKTMGCLSPKQVEVVRKVFEPLFGIDGRMIYPGLQLGAELQATQRLLSGEPFTYSVDWFRYAVLEKPYWDPATWTINDAALAETLNPGNSRSWPSDLAPFRSHGSKMLIYHGGADQQITGLNTERWYNVLSTGMDMTSLELDEFVRFFRVPGMGHCSGSLGAWQVGQSRAAAGGLPFDSKHNVLAAIVDWVERGNTPDRILGTKFNNDTVANGIQFQRWHCRWVPCFGLTMNADNDRYPLRSSYIGGDSSLPENWMCK